MAVNLANTYSASIEEYFIAKGARGRRGTYDPKTTFSPITYTSLRGWMFLNYTLLVILMSLPALIAYEIVRLLT